jgi:cytidine diphosphoramidate kinase
MNNSHVYWITGLANSGKTTLAKILVEQLRAEGIAAVHLDGDELREVYGDPPQFDPPARRQIALRNARLCALLSRQGITVVCSTISLFHEVQEWNRENIPGYREIFLRVPLEILHARDHRGIYTQTAVSGVHFAVEEPKAPDLILDTDGTVAPQALLRRIVDNFS